MLDAVKTLKPNGGEGEAKFEFALIGIEERLVEFDVFLQKFGLILTQMK